MREGSEPGTVRGRGCLRTLIGLVVLLAITWLVLELGAWLLYGPLAGQAYSAAGAAEGRRARVADIDRRLVNSEEGGALQFHPYLGYVGRPGAKPWENVEATNNAFGLLSLAGHPYPYERQPGDFVVVVLGGSVADIFANTMEAELQSALAEQDPRFADRRLVLLSLATGGYKQPQQLFMLEYMLLQGMEPDLVLNLDGFNELALATQNAERGIDPLFPSGFHFGPMAQGLTGDPSPATIATLAALYRSYARERGLLEGLDRSPMRASILASLSAVVLSRFLQGGQAQLQQQLAQDTQVEMPEAFRGPQTAAADPEQVLDRAIETWREASRMIDAVARAYDLPYVHALQPNQYVEGSKVLTENERRIAFNPGHAWPQAAQAGYARLIETGEDLAAEGIDFHDMTQVFQAVEGDIYVDNCCHFSFVGNQILARALAPIIAEATRP